MNVNSSQENDPNQIVVKTKKTYLAKGMFKKKKKGKNVLPTIDMLLPFLVSSSSSPPLMENS